MLRYMLYVLLCCIGLLLHNASAQDLVSKKQSLDLNQKELIDTIESQKQTLKLLDKLHPKAIKTFPGVSLSSFTEKDYLRYPAPIYQPYFKLSATEIPAELEFHGWLQADQDIFFNTAGVQINNGVTDPVSLSNTVDRLWLRRVRPSFEGTFSEYFNFLINIDFGISQKRLFDGFIDINYLRAIGLTSGLQMSLVSGIENFFDNFNYLSRSYTMELSNSAMMAPDREFGFVIHGSFGPSGNEPYYRGLSYLGFDDMFSYQIGVLNGTPDNSNPGLDLLAGDNQVHSSLTNKSFEARFFINPFMTYQNSILEHLGVGMAGSRENVHNESTLPHLVSLGQNPIFQYNLGSAVAQGLRYRLHPQMVWYTGPIGLLADWTQTTQTLCNGSNNGGIYCPINAGTVKQKNNASQIQFIYNFTQEDFNLFHLNPNNNFHLFESGTYGAWQAVLRFTRLSMDRNVFQHNMEYYPYADPTQSISASNSWSIGVNWFWNDNFRITTEYDHSQFTGGFCSGVTEYGQCISGIVTNRPAENILMQRFQFTY